MKTLPTDPGAGAPTLFLTLEADGSVGGWRLLDGGRVIGRGMAEEAIPAPPWRGLLCVPGEQVALHWLELAEGLTAAQAAAAARLMLADASADPLAEMHVAVGRPELGLTPVALVPSGQMAQWLAAAEAKGIDAEAVLPSPLLLEPPESGHACRHRGELADYRASASAFSLEPDLAEAVLGDSPIAPVDEAAFEAGLVPVLARPPLDLRQGPFARRRSWRMERGRTRRIGAFVLALAVLTLAVQVATILSYTFDADRLRAEADALAAGGPGGEGGAGFGTTAAILFDAVRATPNVEVTRLEYRADGNLGATVMLDAPATLAALRSRIEASGLRVVSGEARSAGGRPTADLTLMGRG